VILKVRAKGGKRKKKATASAKGEKQKPLRKGVGGEKVCIACVDRINKKKKKGTGLMTIRRLRKLRNSWGGKKGWGGTRV